MSITFTTPPLKTSIAEQVVIDWLYDLDEVNCIQYSLDDRGLYYAFDIYDYEEMEHEQSIYAPCYFSLREIFSGSIEGKAFYQYLLDNELRDGRLYLYEGTTLRNYP